MGLNHVLTLFSLFISIHTISASLNTYIVHVKTTNLSTHEDLDRWYHSFLPSVSNSSEEIPRIVHCYHNVFKGFAARLSPDHLEAIKMRPGFVSAEPHSVFYQETTHSPNFLGLHQNVGFWEKSNYGRGVIIGVFDGGISPDHPSFRDEGVPPPPAKWKGKCHFKASQCNNKLIGARDFIRENGVPSDGTGHGTHTASIAAGNFIEGASVYGYGNGTASGVAPLAHLAIYKVCGDDKKCYDHDILAAIDASIDDGIDILSMSLRTLGSQPFYSSVIALGTYSAIQKGIFVSCAAGNGGPARATVSNDAPWILTVGASTTDRKLRATATLENGEVLHGESVYTLKKKKWGNIASKPHPLYYPYGNCSEALMDQIVEGRILMCELSDGKEVLKGSIVKQAGGCGMIALNVDVNGDTIATGAHTLPVVHLNYEDSMKLVHYKVSTTSHRPTAKISSQGTLIGDTLAPQVAYFSGRGPSSLGRGVLKPDILGPGVNIIGSWPISVGIVTPRSRNIKTYFNLMSGTSMSCPHLSGIAALLKSAHPDWSPAAIKSAMMTTADVINLGNNPIQDEKKHPADVFAMGSGQVNPSKADDPGLVYDIEPNDYFSYLCGLNYTDAQIGKFGDHKVKCTTRISQEQLNYPSFSIVFGDKVQKYTRTVTNVGEAVSVYSVRIVPPSGVRVTVTPEKLSFTKVNQKLVYEVIFELVKPVLENYVGQGSITWISERHSVRIPIAALPTVAKSS